MQSPQFSLMHRSDSALGLNKLALLSQPQFHTTATTVEQESSPGGDAITAAFEAEVERLDRATDAIIADSWDDVKLPKTSTDDEEKRESSLDDEDDGDSIISFDDESLTQELQQVDKLMHNDPNALSAKIFKIIRENDDVDVAPSFITNPPQGGDVTVVEEAVITTQPTRSKLAGVPLESRILTVDRSLFVGDTLRVIEAGVNNVNPTELIHFTGPIGSESRSISTSQPLPRPQVLMQQERQDMVTQKGSKDIRDSSKMLLKPFVSPFVNMTCNVSSVPRLVSYYEIEITKNSSSLEKGKDKVGSVSSVSSDDGSGGETKTVWDKPCIAVGLAGSNFPMKDTMPGWKLRSFGYHSDDGSAWGDRMKVSDYGYEFGIGDVVGCGIDYRIGAVFYTMNGKFLGLAFSLDEDELALDWYPTIGLDSHDFVACNFGYEKTFDFDLAEYCDDEPPPPLPSRILKPVSHASRSLRR